MSANSPTHSSGKVAPKPDFFEKALERYRMLPRAGRWGAIAGVVFIGFTLLDSVFWPIADDLNARADRLTTVLERASSRAEEFPEEIEASAIVHGPNLVPGREMLSKEKLASTIVTVLREKGVNQFGLDIRPAQPLPSTVLPEIAAELGGQMGRSVADLRFEATPDVATTLVAELDKNPAIDAVSDLKLTYNPQTKRVAVQMSLEKWGVVNRTVRGGA
ncbi:MAG: hypothetical protein ACO3QC_01955 [Phycisphaerales bacterium]